MLTHLLGNTLSFIVALGVIMFVHEAGHLLVAKAFRIRVHTFSLGFGKRLWGFRRGETDYRVSLVPLGGYVRLSGEHPDEVSEDPHDFMNHPRWQRILVYLAGPAMNVGLALALGAVVFMVGLDVPSLRDIPAIVGTVEAGSPAELAGMAPGDRVATVRGEPIERWQDFALAVMESPERPLAITVQRDRERIPLEITPIKNERYELGDAGVYPRILPRISMVVAGGPAEAAGFLVDDEIRGVDGRALASPADFVQRVESHLGQEIVVEVLRGEELLELAVVPADEGGRGRIGVGLTISRRFGPMEAIVESGRYNWEITTQTFALIGKLVQRRVEVKSALHGPIEIAALSGEAARQGPASLLHLMALVSISIAILNLMPIPVLDGGQITVLLVESLIRRDLSIRLKEVITLAGLAVIVALMVTVLAFDIGRNLPAALRPGAGPPAAEAPAP